MTTEFSIDHSAPDHLNARLKRVENYINQYGKTINTFANKIAELEDKMEQIEDTLYDSYSGLSNR